MCFSEYLLFKFSKNPVDLITAPQGKVYGAHQRAACSCWPLPLLTLLLGDPEELARAQKLVNDACHALDEVSSKLDEQKAAAAANAKAEAECRAAKSGLVC